MKKIKPKNRAELRELVKDNDIYPNDIDTSAITDMRALFKDVECKDFSGIESWDVLKVKDMSFIFYSCATFNQPLDKPANLKNQCRMFHNCKGFTYSLNDKKMQKDYLLHYYFIYEAINK